MREGVGSVGDGTHRDVCNIDHVTLIWKRGKKRKKKAALFYYVSFASCQVLKKKSVLGAREDEEYKPSPKSTLLA